MANMFQNLSGPSKTNYSSIVNNLSAYKNNNITENDFNNIKSLLSQLSRALSLYTPNQDETVALNGLINEIKNKVQIIIQAQVNAAPVATNPPQQLALENGQAGLNQINGGRKKSRSKAKRGGQELALINNIGGISDISNLNNLTPTKPPLQQLAQNGQFANIPQPFSSGIQPFGGNVITAQLGITNEAALNPMLGGRRKNKKY